MTTCRPAVCLTVSGPGLINALSGMANAKENSWYVNKFFVFVYLYVYLCLFICLFIFILADAIHNVMHFFSEVWSKKNTNIIGI